jgi:hypothetical protein
VVPFEVVIQELFTERVVNIFLVCIMLILLVMGPK